MEPRASCISMTRWCNPSVIAKRCRTGRRHRILIWAPTNLPLTADTTLPTTSLTSLRSPIDGVRLPQQSLLRSRHARGAQASIDDPLNIDDVADAVAVQIAAASGHT